MRNLIGLAAGGLAAWYYGDHAGRWLYGHLGGPADYMRMMGWFLAFFGGAILASVVLSFRRKSGGGVSAGGWAIVLRPVTGGVIALLAEALVLLAFVSFGAWIINTFVPIPTEVARERVILLLVLATGAFYALVLGAKASGLYRMIGGAFAPLRRMLRIAGFGKGGSAAFAGLFSEWETLWRPGSILLGRSAYGRDWKIGLKDDRHLLTIASTGGGKGRSAIIPNLLTWPGSALVIDPKGTNAAVTAGRRGWGRGRVTDCMGQDVHIFDPFGVVSFVADSASFNPLAQLDPKSDRIVEDIWKIADALVVSDPHTAAHWDDSARSLISGLIAHVLTAEPEETRTLGRVRDLLTDPLFIGTQDDIAYGRSVVGQMIRNKEAGELAARAAAQINTAGKEERGNIVSGAMRHTNWLDSKPMRKVLTGAGFDLADLKRKRLTVYVVIPPEELENHKRFLRLFVTLGMAAMTREQTRPKDRVLFIIDEFAALGRLEAVRTGINIIRSYGVILWPIIQNIGQLKHLYQEDVQTFLDATGAVQVFSIGGRETAEMIAANLGERLVDRKARGQLITAMSALRTTGEVQEETDRDWQTEIVLRSGKQPLLLKRVMYDKAFRRNQFSPDPDHPEPARFSDATALRSAGSKLGRTASLGMEWLTRNSRAGIIRRYEEQDSGVREAVNDIVLNHPETAAESFGKHPDLTGRFTNPLRFASVIRDHLNQKAGAQ